MEYEIFKEDDFKDGMEFNGFGVKRPISRNLESAVYLTHHANLLANKWINEHTKLLEDDKPEPMDTSDGDVSGCEEGCRGLDTIKVVSKEDDESSKIPPFTEDQLAHLDAMIGLHKHANGDGSHNVHECQCGWVHNQLLEFKVPKEKVCPNCQGTIDMDKIVQRMFAGCSSVPIDLTVEPIRARECTNLTCLACGKPLGGVLS